MEFGDERHTTRHTTERYATGPTVLVTVVADEGVHLRDMMLMAHGRKVADLPMVTAERGAELQVRPHIARQWLAEDPSKVVVVDEAKLGKAQRGLLLRLHEIETMAQSSAHQPYRWAATRWYGASGNSIDARRGFRWSPDAVHDGPVTPSVRASLSRSLRALERRGLVLRDAPAGSARRTQTVQLTAAGRRVAKRLSSEADEHLVDPTQNR